MNHHLLNNIAAINSIIIALIISGCTIGGNVTKSHVAKNPGGDELSIQLKNDLEFQGEFLSLLEKSVIILVKFVDGTLPEIKNAGYELPVVAQLYFEGTQSIELEHADMKLLTRGSLASIKEINYMKLYSRYPQGMDRELINRILKVYNQDSLVTLGK